MSRYRKLIHQMQFLYSEGYTMYTVGIPPPSNHCRLHFGERQPLGRIYEPLPSKLYSPNAIPVLGGLHHVYRWHTTSK
ncbi:MAG: hypothetical protein IPH52_17540 [Leptospiraceae bacterium]|nr:hypothetical protein [Leptospiraceae bacterium]